MQKSFPNWFQELWLFMGATPNIFCPEIGKSFDYFKANSDSFFPSGNSYSLFFYAQFRIPWIYVGTFVPTNFLQDHSLSIWPGNSKLNGGLLSKYLKPKPLILLKNGLKPKSPNQRSPQSQNPRYHYGPNLCQTQHLSPILLQKTHFLQIQPIGPISKKSKNKQLRHCPNSLTQTQMRKTLQTSQPSSKKMKTCATNSHTLPLSNGNSNIFKSLCLRERTGLKLP